MEGRNVELEDKVYGWKELLETGFGVDEYEWADFTGEHEVTIDARCWGQKKQSGSIVVSGTTADGRKVKFTCWQQRKPPYFGLADISNGSVIRVTFKESRRVSISSVSSVELL